LFTHTLRYGGPLAAALIVWALDRLIRFIRLIINNNSFSSQYSSNALEAHAEIVTNKLVRLVVRQPSRFHWKPGQTAYLTIPSLTHFPLEAHPFTIGSYDGAQSQNVTPASPFWKELVFLINVRGGVTRKLKQAATQEGNINVLVDGPYGDAHDLRCFSSCTLIAGGSGVSYTVPVLLDIIEWVSYFSMVPDIGRLTDHTRK
jgi:ferric-chelate reductase